MTDLEPRQIADFIGWLIKQPSGRASGTLTDSSVRNAFKPLAACLATPVNIELQARAIGNPVQIGHRTLTVTLTNPLD